MAYLIRLADDWTLITQTVIGFEKLNPQSQPNQFG